MKRTLAPLVAVTALACSELPECADYRLAETSALAEWMNAQEHLKSAREAKDELEVEWGPTLGPGTRADFRETWHLIEGTPWESLLQLREAVPQAEAQVQSAANKHAVAVAVRTSQGCSAPKPIPFGEDE